MCGSELVKNGGASYCPFVISLTFTHFFIDGLQTNLREYDIEKIHTRKEV